jgi:glycosyltransferase involved in cell wall biosynthesis
VVGEGNFGFLTPPGDAAALAAALDRAAAIDGSGLRALGEAGRKYVERFEWANVLAEFERTLQTMETACHQRSPS